MTTVLIADDDDLMRAGLIELLTADPRIQVAGEAATGRDAVALARRLAPDVVLMDVRMPDLDGIAATRQLVGAVPEAKVLILTTFEQDDYVFGALRAGASGFLLKRTRPEDLIAAVHTIADGDCLLSPSVTRRVIDRMAHQPAPDLAGQARLAGLTPREREVLALIARGLSNREIAAALFIEESTIRTHVKRVLLKLGLRDRIQAVIFAYEAGINQTPAMSGKPASRPPGPGASRT
jgi:DNA-binding NarL/FixJ family response regulator